MPRTTTTTMQKQTTTTTTPSQQRSQGCNLKTCYFVFKILNFQLGSAAEERVAKDVALRREHDLGGA